MNTFRKFGLVMATAFVAALAAFSVSGLNPTAAGASSAGSAKAPSCPPAHSKRLLSNRQAVVWRRGSSLHGCVRGRRSVNIRPLDGLTATVQRRLTGRFYSALVTVGETGGMEEVITVADLRSGKRRYWSLGCSSIEPPLCSDSSPSIRTDYIAKPTGSVAWVAVYPGASGAPTTYEVRKIDGNSPDRRTGDPTDPNRGNTLLDKGEAIDPASLKLSGSTLTWTNAGETKTAALY